MARETRTETDMEIDGTAEEETNCFSSSSLKLYEAQFFGFTPQTCMLRIYSAFHDSLNDIVPVVEEVCVRKLRKGQSDKDDEQLRSQARECSRRLQQFMEKRFKQLSERMEALLVSRCFTVPPNVLLPEDQSHKEYPQDIQEILKLESSMADLHGAYEAEVCARQALLAELEEQKEVQKQMDGILEWVMELRAAWVKHGNGNFQETFQLAMMSIKKLQEAVEQVLVCSRTCK